MNDDDICQTSVIIIQQMKHKLSSLSVVFIDRFQVNSYQPHSEEDEKTLTLNKL